MDNRRLVAMLVLLVALAVGFMTAPVLSGEHPWDSDRTEGDGNGGTGGVVNYDTVPIADTIVVVTVVQSSASGTSTWIGILTTAWSVSWTM